MIAQRRRAAGDHAEGNRGPRIHGLARWLRRDGGRRNHRHRGQEILSRLVRADTHGVGEVAGCQRVAVETCTHRVSTGGQADNGVIAIGIRVAHARGGCINAHVLHRGGAVRDIARDAESGG